ncbi:protein of unknown function [Bradyrhizobium sp. ORS 285]|uniref:AAA family ATPase n=1 Tax=Bradyrhizobium sp. ORS 285 TaxID=115808 RepID=UPI0002406110|nr:AAA family ATPase [Bradyrhizobium sp. ORS 285]CCD83655.1 hypothetical protein BRAO285_100066 [Bradyrhizobium sp. ORS 285]SMX57166.1 protein of unknown function [Bradyrhizobium sp. ORS 285]
MKISFENFRGFKAVGPTEVRPITLLVGENSSGKTSFQAALRYLLSVSSFLSQESTGFNQSPFLLGGFEDIAYSRVGRRGTNSNYFSIAVQRRTHRMSDRNSVPLAENIAGEYRMSLRFFDWLGQPALQAVEFAVDAKAVLIDFVEMKVVFKDQEKNRSYEYEVAHEMHPQLEQTRRIPSSMGIIISQLFFLTFGRDIPSRRVILSTDAGNEVESFKVVLSTAYHVFFNSSGDLRVLALSPMRTEPKRVYEVLDAQASPMGAHVPIRLAQEKVQEIESWNLKRDYFSRFGKEAGLFSNIDIRRLGSTQNDPFQIMVSVGGKKRNIVDVGYGVSQVLPLLYEMAETSRRKLLLMQQPEVHLHPKAQAELGSLIVDTHSRMKHNFVVETHSDFIVDRIRNHIRLGELKPSQVSLLYFHRPKDELVISHIELDDRGDVVSPPIDYRDFFYREEKNLFGF